MLRFVEGNININVLLSFVFGVLFVITMLAFAVWVPNPSSFAQWVFITVLALAAAGVGSVVPGMLNVDLPYVKAGGALALFVIVFLMKPAIVTAVARIDPPLGPPDQTIQAYLAKADANDMDAAWNQLDPEAQIGVARDKDAYRQVYAAGRLPLGKVERRTFMGVQEFQSPSGYPLGVYRIIGYQTQFAGGDCREEKVMVRGSSDRVWRVYEHSLSPHTMPCLKN